MISKWDKLHTERTKLSVLREKLSDWLLNNIKHEDFEKKISERNALSVKINILTIKMEYAAQGLPTNGYMLPKEAKKLYDNGKKTN